MNRQYFSLLVGALVLLVTVQSRALRAQAFCMVSNEGFVFNMTLNTATDIL